MNKAVNSAQFIVVFTHKCSWTYSMDVHELAIWYIVFMNNSWFDDKCMKENPSKFMVSLFVLKEIQWKHIIFR